MTDERLQGPDRAATRDTGGTRTDELVAEIERLSAEVAALTKARRIDEQKHRQKLLFHTEQIDALIARLAKQRDEMDALLKLKQDWWHPELERRADHIAELEETQTTVAQDLDEVREALSRQADIAMRSVEEVIRLARPPSNPPRRSLVRRVLNRRSSWGQTESVDTESLYEAAQRPHVLRSLVRCTDLFDPAWYLETYPDVAATGQDALDHFVSFGCLEGRAPGPNFDPEAYYQRYEDVQESGHAAFIHYLVFGLKEGRTVC